MGMDLNRHWNDPSSWAHPTIFATKSYVVDLDEDKVGAKNRSPLCQNLVSFKNIEHIRFLFLFFRLIAKYPFYKVQYNALICSDDGGKIYLKKKQVAYRCAYNAMSLVILEHRLGLCSRRSRQLFASWSVYLWQ